MPFIVPKLACYAQILPIILEGANLYVQNNYITLRCKASQLQHRSQTGPGRPLGDLPSYRMKTLSLGPGSWA